MIKKVLLIIVTSLLSAGVLYAQIQSGCDNAKSTADRYYDNNDWNNAIKAYKDLKEKCPDYKIYAEQRISYCNNKQLNNKPKPAKTEEFEIYTHEMHFEADSGVQNLRVKAKNVEWELGAIMLGWMEVKRSGKDTFLTVSVDQNTSIEKRVSWFVINSNRKTGKLKDTIRVIQDGAKPFLKVPDNIIFSDSSDNKSVSVMSNCEWNIVKINDNWVHVKKAGKTLLVSVDLNRTSSKRTGSFSIRTIDGSIERPVYVEQSAPFIFKITGVDFICTDMENNDTIFSDTVFYYSGQIKTLHPRIYYWTNMDKTIILNVKVTSLDTNFGFPYFKSYNYTFLLPKLCLLK